MHNRATNLFSESDRSLEDRGGGWRVDPHPGRRLLWLFVAFVLPLAAIFARVAELQCRLVDDYISAFERTSESTEPIPSVDGRIYAGDGRVLAEDVERYHISVHYRWLEEPPDERWLTRQACAKLSRSQRRNRALVEAEKRHLRTLRSQMWKRLSELSGMSQERLAEKCTAIQKRVTQISNRVRAQERRGEDGGTQEPQCAEPKTSSGSGMWQALRSALTTPPRREGNEPIVIREELEYHPVIENVSLEVRAEIEAHPRWFPGVRVGRTSQRVYHDSRFAPHLVGTRLPVSEEELGRRAALAGGTDPLDYRPGDRMGRTGVEASYDSHLRGLRGLRKLVRNRYGEIVRETVIRAPRPGADVELTINSAVQRRMEQALDALLDEKVPSPTHDPAHPGEKQAPRSTGGSVVALDVHSGAVLVAASAPRFDLGSSAIPDRETWQRLVDDPRRPLFHRATQMALPPGSVFKAVSAIALLESRQIDPDVRYDCRGYLAQPDRLRCLIYTQQHVGHGPIDLSGALSRSCNVYFFHAAGVVGHQQIVEWASRFGIGRPTGIDLPFEGSGHLPDSEAAEQGAAHQTHKQWQIGEARLLAIGQSNLTMTPLQVARTMAAIANGGYLVTPFVARKSGPQVADDDAVLDFDRRKSISGLSEQTLVRIRSALRKTVSEPDGTGYKTVRSNQIWIAGKTGTAEVGGGKPDHAWFAGYVPADNPQIAFAVVLEHAGSGGKTAGPVARALVEAFLADGVLMPTRVTLRE